MRAYFKSLFSIAGLKRLFSSYVISYLGVFLSLSFLSIIFWGSVSSPSAISGVIRESGVEENLMLDLAKRSNSSAIATGDLNDQEIKDSINSVFDSQLMSDVNMKFSEAFHEWIKTSGDFSFNYDLSAQQQSLMMLNSNINTKFLTDGQLKINYKSDESSLKFKPHRTYDYFWRATLLSPVLFVVLALTLWFTYNSKLDLLFKIKRMLFYSSISVLLTLPITYGFWTYFANRLSTYPKAGDVGALSIRPITSEIMGRMALVTILSFVIYTIGFFAIKKYLSRKGFKKVDHKHKNDLLEFTVQTTKYYYNKLK